MKKLLLLILVVASAVASFEVTRSIDRTSVQIGEPLVLTINIDRKPEDKLIYPGPGTSFGDFDLKDMRTEVENKNGRVIEHKQYQLQVFKLGQGVIPQLKIVSATDTSDYKLTDSVTIIVKSSLTPADTGDIDDIYSPVSLPLGTGFWVTFFGVFAALVLALFLFDRFFRNKKAAPAPPPPPPEPPQVVFGREIEALIADDLLNKGEVKTFHIRISEILRRYLGSRLNFEALESTTTELMEVLRAKGVSAPVIRKVEAFASVNDPVKFAKWIPASDVSLGLIDYAKEIVQDTTSSLE